MACFGDTNILLRSVEPNHPAFADAVGAVSHLLAQGEIVYFNSQIVREFWNVCTRPRSANGLGKTPLDARAEVENLTHLLTYLPDHPDVAAEWMRLATTYSVSGVQVHDTNLVAFMLVHGIDTLLTLNPTHFQRFREITVVTPQDILRAAGLLPSP